MHVVGKEKAVISDDSWMPLLFCSGPMLLGLRLYRLQCTPCKVANQTIAQIAIASSSPAT